MNDKNTYSDTEFVEHLSVVDNEVYTTDINCIELEKSRDFSKQTTRLELLVMWWCVLVFGLTYGACYLAGIKYQSILHAKIIYSVFVFFNVLGAYIALNAWRKIPPESTGRMALLLLTVSLNCAALGNLLDLLLWLTNYCMFKESVATNILFVLAIVFALPGVHLLGKICHVKPSKNSLLYFIIITFITVLIPFLINPMLIKRLYLSFDFKESLFGMIYAFSIGYLASFSLYIWRKAQGRLKHSAQLISIGLTLLSLGCAIYAGLFFKLPVYKIPSNTVHIIIALSYIILGLSIMRVEKTLSMVYALYNTSLPPSLPFVELWGPNEGLKIYKQMENKIKESQRALLQAQAEARARQKVIKDLENEVQKRIEAEKEMQLAVEKAEVANKAKSEFLAMMSHELKTPLTAIKGYSKLIYDNTMNIAQSKPEMIKNLGKQISDNSDHLQYMIDSILKFSQLESGKFVSEIEEFCLQDLIDKVKNAVDFQKDMSKAELNLNIPKEPVYVSTDRNALQQILINLLINAFKFCNKGKVFLLAQVKDEDLFISVKDTGIGIEESELGKIFTPFHQVSRGNKRKYDGTGLGLSIVKKLVEELKGHIFVKSKKGEFTRFDIVLPKVIIKSENDKSV